MSASCERLVRNDSRRMLKKLFTNNRFARRVVTTDPRVGTCASIASTLFLPDDSAIWAFRRYPRMRFCCSRLTCQLKKATLHYSLPKELHMYSRTLEAEMIRIFH
jgi:hypothetical protein